jgi:hypothetical protein
MVDTTTEQQPISLNDIIADLKGFGIEDFDTYIPLTCGNKTLQIKLANIPSDEELIALTAVEEFKGYEWLQRVKAEIISRSISWVNGVEIRKLPPQARMVVDPLDGQSKDIQVVLRNLLTGWGQEYMLCLWKVLMVHSQNIENRLLESFPEAAVMTEVERRFTERVKADIESHTRDVIEDQVEKLFDDEKAAS